MPKKQQPKKQKNKKDASIQGGESKSADSIDSKAGAKQAPTILEDEKGNFSSVAFPFQKQPSIEAISKEFADQVRIGKAKHPTRKKGGD